VHVTKVATTSMTRPASAGHADFKLGFKAVEPARDRSETPKLNARIYSVYRRGVGPT
jgi:F420-0:gamma-glutamyl ligase